MNFWIMPVIFWLAGLMFTAGFFMAVDGPIPLGIQVRMVLLWPIFLGLGFGASAREANIKLAKEIDKDNR